MKKLLISLLPFISCSIAHATPQSDTLIAKTISAVTVVAAKPFIQVMVDKTVLNIAARPSLGGQNALELLKSAPGVVVDPNENISMGGKSGVTIMIDDRNTQLSSQDLAQLLKSIDADNIKEIEIITNPSARFDASGNAGIINIKLKKSISNGLNGSISSNYTQSTHARGSGTVNFNYRKNKWNLFVNGGANKGYQITTANNERLTPAKQFLQRGFEGDDFKGANFRTGIDYNLNKKTTIGILWMHNNRFTEMDNNNYTLVKTINLSDTNVFTRSIAPSTTARDNFNFNYRLLEDKKSELNIDADYTKFQSALNNTITTDKLNQTNTKFATNGLENNAAVRIEIKSIKLDYLHHFTEKTQIETGFKSVYSTAQNQINIKQLNNANWVEDSSKSNSFNYNEFIQAAYISFQTKLNKFTVQAGLRGEYSQVKGQSTDLKNTKIEKPDTSYMNLFPTIFVQYALNEKHQLGFSYSRRIDRPSYQDQNPFIYVLDAFNSEQGNPYLIPQLTHAIELNYTNNNAHSIKIQYAVTNQYIESLTYQNGSQTILTPQNVGKRKVLNIALSSSFSPKKWWNIYMNAEPFYQQYETLLNGFGTYESVKQESWGFNGYLSNTFNLTKGWKADLSGWFNFQNATTIYKSKPLASVNFGISKKILQDKASLKLGITDLFNTQRWEQNALTSNLNLRTYRKWESSNISISFSYRFGNAKIKSARNRETGASNEMGRIK
ncbi:MAG: TonB-dependent receptor [Sphingobacteriia bacterium]|nr:MAG: TonB-dependent receptor [Sphingobacteriia bacterium]